MVILGLVVPPPTPPSLSTELSTSPLCHQEQVPHISAKLSPLEQSQPVPLHAHHHQRDTRTISKISHQVMVLQQSTLCDQFPLPTNHIWMSQVIKSVSLQKRWSTSSLKWLV